MLSVVPRGIEACQDNDVDNAQRVIMLKQEKNVECGHKVKLFG